MSGIKPLTVTKRQAKELLSPKLVDRLIYAAKNFPEMGWLEIYPRRRVRRFGRLISCMKAWSERFSEFEPESIRQNSRRTSKTERSARR